MEWYPGVRVNVRLLPRGVKEGSGLYLTQTVASSRRMKKMLTHNDPQGKERRKEVPILTLFPPSSLLLVTPIG